MLNFSIHTDSTAPSESAPMLEQLAAAIGFAPNIFAATAESSPALAGLMAINGSFAASSFTPEEQQLILMATSVENGCVYCVAGHTLMSQGLDIADDVVHAMRNKQFISNPRYAALREMVGALIHHRGRISETTMTNFLDQGYSKAQFFELVLGVSVKTFTNYVSNALTLPLDEAFTPYRWERPADLKKTA